VLGAIKLRRAARRTALLDTEYDEVSKMFASAVFASAAACIVSAERDLRATAAGSRVHASAAAVCATASLTFTSGRSHGKTRLRSVHAGGTNDLAASCTVSGGAIRLRVASRSHRPLRKSLGSRLTLGVARSPRDPAGGRLSFSYRKG
jgi:hypothetical protein